MERYNGNVDFKFTPPKDSKTISISTILGMLVEPFDQVAVAQKTYNKHHNNPDSEYFNMTVDQIVEKWKEKGKVSLMYGRLNDEYIGRVLEGTANDVEMFMLDHDVDSDERLKTQVEAFNSFIENLPDSIKLVAREKTLYCKMSDTWIKGRFDALLFDESKNMFIVVDWKTSGTVDTVSNTWTQKMLGPAKCFDALNWYSYTIQCYFYKMALLENGYLPEGYDENSVGIRIVNFPGKKFEDTGLLYKSYQPAFKYDKELLSRIFEFGIKKNKLMNR